MSEGWLDFSTGERTLLRQKSKNHLLQTSATDDSTNKQIKKRGRLLFGIEKYDKKTTQIVIRRFDFRGLNPQLLSGDTETIEECKLFFFFK